MRGDNGNRHDVSGIFRDDIGDDEVDLIGRISRVASSSFDDVPIFDKALGGLHLDTPKPLAGIKDKIVALALTPGLSDAEAETSGFGEKGGFDGFPPRFAGGQTDSLDFRNAIVRRILLSWAQKEAQHPGCALFLPTFRIPTLMG